MATGEIGKIRINVFNGERKPVPPTVELLVTALNGLNKTVRSQFVEGGAIDIPHLMVQESFADRHTFLVSAKGHVDAGFTPVVIKDDSHVLDLMLLRRDTDFTFKPFEDLALQTDLLRLLRGDGPDEARVVYNRLLADKPALACLLNVTTALEQMRLVPMETGDVNPMKLFMALESAHADRMFAWASVPLLQQVRQTADKKGAGGVAKIASAIKGLHPGATASFKQTDFGEANVQLSFHENEERLVKGQKCMLVDVDIDYFKDNGAHLLLEVFPNKLKKLLLGKDSPESVSDPRLVYGLRWISGRRRNTEFAPPYFLKT